MDKSWIDRYFEGDLSPEEEQALLDRVAQDPELRAEWKFQQSVKRSIHRNERKALKNFLQEVEAGRSRGRVQLWAGAAASLLLITGIWFYFLRDNGPSLAQAYFHPLPNLVSPVVRSADRAGESDAAFRAYEDGRYAQAAKEFKKGGGNPHAALYQAICYLAIDSTGAALHILEGFSASDEDLPWETYRKWYLGITFMKIGEKQKAQALFKELAAYTNPVQEKAAEILEKLR